MNVLVTGGAGFIGSHLVAALLARGDSVRVLDNLSSGSLDNLGPVLDRIDFRRGDVCERRDVEAAMTGMQAVLHEAALVSVPESVADPRKAHDVNSGGTLEVLLAAAAAGAQRVVIASSCAVYGDRGEGARSESQPARPASPYAASKLAAEAHVASAAAMLGLRAISLRYFNVFGAGQSASSAYAAVVPRFAAMLAAGESPIVYGDGGQTRDFCHVDDVVAANLLALEAPESSSGEAYNVGSGVAVSILDLLAAMGRVLGLEAAPCHAPGRAGDLRHSLADLTHARAGLGYAPRVGLDEGLQRTLAG